MLTMPTDPQSWNIPDIVAAVIADDPDAAQIAKAAGVGQQGIQTNGIEICHGNMRYQK